MTATVTIRLHDEDRGELERRARELGLGVSSLLRELAEAEARRLRREAIRAAGQEVVDHIAAEPSARQELADLGVPQAETR